MTSIYGAAGTSAFRLFFLLPTQNQIVVQPCLRVLFSFSKIRDAQVYEEKLLFQEPMILPISKLKAKFIMPKV